MFKHLKEQKDSKHFVKVPIYFLVKVIWKSYLKKGKGRRLLNLFII